MKYGELTLGQVEAIVNKLGGMDGVRRLLAGEAERPRPYIEKTIELEIDYGVPPADLTVANLPAILLLFLLPALGGRTWTGLHVHGL